MKVYIDVTNLMMVNFLSGIQRVVREVLVRLLKYEDFEIVLLTQKASGNRFEILDADAFYRYFRDSAGKKTDVWAGRTLLVDEIQPGSVFFEIDSVWNSVSRRSELLPKMKDIGVKVVTYIYDIIPVTNPQFFHINTLYYFMDYFGANIQYADALIVSTQSVLDSIYRVTDSLKLPRVPGFVSWLGSDFQIRPTENKVDDAVKRFIAQKKRYVLIVGTVEPRKNHKILLDAFEQGLFEKNVCLVIVGRIGWNVEALEKRIRSHPELGTQLFFFEGLNDASVDALYQEAYFVAFPTYDEGFGLPMIEAFERGIPVIASDKPVLREVGGDKAVYFRTESADSFKTVLNFYLDHLEEYQKLKEKVNSYVPFTWDQTTERIAAAIRTLEGSAHASDKKIRQLAILSARCSDLCDTLPFVERFMPFINELVLCCPDDMKEEFLKRYSGNLHVVIITDSMLLAGNTLPSDHVLRNFYLRSLMMRRPELDPVFLMGDDDYRPLEMIDPSVFVKDKKYQAYYCYSLRSWRGTPGRHSSYDYGMFRTLEFLDQHRYSTYQYSSHMPQVIDKERYQEFLNLHPGVENLGIDEWSGYFNWLQTTYPNLVQPRPYVTMCWPGEHTHWKLEVVPPRYLFENYYEELYHAEGIFAGFSSVYHSGIAQENEKKRRLFEEKQNHFLDCEKVYEIYREQYMERFREIPSFVIEIGDSLKMHVPQYVVLPYDGFVRLPILLHLDPEKTGKEIKLSYILEKEDGHRLLWAYDAVCVEAEDTMEVEFPLFTREKQPETIVLILSASYQGEPYEKRLKAILVEPRKFINSRGKR